MDFSLSEAAKKRKETMRFVAEHVMRPISRQYDEQEHEDPWEFFNTMWEASKGNREATKIGSSGDGKAKKGSEASEGTLLACIQIEELAWGDAGLYLSIPNPALGRGHTRAAGAVPQALLRRQAALGCDGDHRASLRLGLEAGGNHRAP
jgi:acyl-CoA dehydrogenase